MVAPSHTQIVVAKRNRPCCNRQWRPAQFEYRRMWTACPCTRSRVWQSVIMHNNEIEGAPPNYSFNIEGEGATEPKRRTCFTANAYHLSHQLREALWIRCCRQALTLRNILLSPRRLAYFKLGSSARGLRYRSGFSVHDSNISQRFL